MAKREIVEVLGLTVADVDWRELGANILIVRSGRSELQDQELHSEPVRLRTVAPAAVAAAIVALYLFMAFLARRSNSWRGDSHSSALPSFHLLPNREWAGSVVCLKDSFCSLRAQPRRINKRGHDGLYAARHQVFPIR
jgi:hypothetical protein